MRAGVAWLPCWLMGPEVRGGRLEMILNGDQVLGTEINAVWPHMTHLPLQVRVAIDALVSEIPKVLS